MSTAVLGTASVGVCASRVSSYCRGRYAVPYLAVFTGVAGNWVLQLVIACECDVLRLQAYEVVTRVPFGTDMVRYVERHPDKDKEAYVDVGRGSARPFVSRDTIEQLRAGYQVILEPACKQRIGGAARVC